MSRFDEINAAEEDMMPVPEDVTGYNVTKDGDEYLIELFQGINILRTIGGYPAPHHTVKSAHAHARRLGYRPM